MSKSKSQWDFGELFPPSHGSSGATSPTEQTRRVLSVSELTGQIRALLEKQIGSVWVSGEITNLRAQSSGHIYFTLKDAASQLSCVLFSREKVPHRGLLADGQKVLLQGDVTVYEARGQYQLIVRAVELQGVGALQIAFEKLKQQLAAEGLFAPARKRPLPNTRNASAWSHPRPARPSATCCTSSAGEIRAWKSSSRHAACRAKARRRKLRRPSGC